jgi:hypothetical protein
MRSITPGAMLWPTGAPGVGGPVTVVQTEPVPLPVHVTVVVPVGLVVVQVEPVAVSTHVVVVVVVAVLGGAGAVVRKPVWSTKANPDGVPVVV